jgi:hypothetical protein
VRVVVGIAIAAIVVSLLAAACQSTGAPASEAKSTVPEGPLPTIEASGFGGSGDYLWVTSTVRDVPMGQFATVSFNLYGTDGTLLATESQTEQGINPGARIMVGTHVNAPKGQPVTRIEPTLQVSEHDPVMPAKFSDVMLEIGPATLGHADFIGQTAEAVLTNPSGQQIPGARVGVACFDKQGAITGGGSDHPEVLPANGQLKVSAGLLVSGTPDHCEMTAQPSDL